MGMAAAPEADAVAGAVCARRAQVMYKVMYKQVMCDQLTCEQVMRKEATRKHVTRRRVICMNAARDRRGDVIRKGRQ